MVRRSMEVEKLEKKNAGPRLLVERDHLHHASRRSMTSRIAEATMALVTSESLKGSYTISDDGWMIFTYIMTFFLALAIDMVVRWMMRKMQSVCVNVETHETENPQLKTEEELQQQDLLQRIDDDRTEGILIIGELETEIENLKKERDRCWRIQTEDNETMFKQTMRISQLERQLLQTQLAKQPETQEVGIQADLLTANERQLNQQLTERNEWCMTLFRRIGDLERQRDLLIEELEDLR